MKFCCHTLTVRLLYIIFLKFLTQCEVAISKSHPVYFHHQLVLIRTEECSFGDGDENKAATVWSSCALPAAAFSTRCDLDVGVATMKNVIRRSKVAISIGLRV